VVVKVVSPEVVHKSEVGGVAAGVASDEALLQAFNHMAQIKGFAGVIVEEVLKGVELIIGATMDEQFGPIVLLGAGGTTTEICRDVTFGMAPLCDNEVDRMIQRLKAGPLLTGFRGSEPVDLGELNRLVIKFSNLVAELGDMVESVDLNPVICSGQRCVVADARIMLHR
jgi:hypothetical protein